MGKYDFLTVELCSEVICEHNGMVHVAVTVDGSLAGIFVVSESEYERVFLNG
ncbi:MULTISPECIES: hypothetical protein [Bacillus]|uniref:hypothetical protein n=1 Tax=Bacillus TaxID=1386 RepID=UPI0008153AB3|nr:MULTISPECIES: hypothetical protein [Bacillus]MBU8787129.1 hypothetical protein [Bacillus glycinifermentans]MDU0070045.1 hypothetical protein [Bacillus sp. IG6]MED8017718.1 hypothetical protein [Bacillus glycinifermentans]WKB76109.1 hypothetical protein QYM22_17110 [Bacillus glycinifermentans]SCA87158.1 hypothetical protein BGLY_3335 [Bacillus glycinifermentans]